MTRAFTKSTYESLSSSGVDTDGASIVASPPAPFPISRAGVLASKISSTFSRPSPESPG